MATHWGTALPEGQPAAPSEPNAQAVATDAALVEVFGPQPEHSDLPRSAFERLAWSRTLARRQSSRPANKAPAKAATDIVFSAK